MERHLSYLRSLDVVIDFRLLGYFEIAGRMDEKRGSFVSFRLLVDIIRHFKRIVLIRKVKIGLNLLIWSLMSWTLCEGV